MKRTVKPTRGVFVSGTDTGVGKTLAGCALARARRARGWPVGVMKPVETGVGPDGALDALALRDAAGVSDPIDLICPQSFAMPAAPGVAARAEDRAVDLGSIDAAWAQLRARHEWMLVEGAGGLLVPLTPELDMAGLAARFGLPVLLVARTRLGTINHTRLCLEALETRGLALAGVLLCHADGPLSAADAENLGALREELGEGIVAEIPPLEDRQRAMTQLPIAGWQK